MRKEKKEIIKEKLEKFKAYVYSVIRDDDKNDIKGNIFDSIIITLVVVNVLIIFLDTFDNVRMVIEPYYKIIDVLSILVFTLEYALRIWTSPLKYPHLPPAKARIKFMLTIKSLIDLVALISFYLPLLSFDKVKIMRVIRLLRILSLLKINRYSDALSALGSVIRKKSIQLLSSLFIIMVLIIFASLLMYYIENGAQPASFNNAYSSLWWAISTLTTVGYGDIYPVTILGKLLGILISLMGIALIAIPTGLISAGFMEQTQNKEKSDAKEKAEADKEDIHFCPYCGKKIK